MRQSGQHTQTDPVGQPVRTTVFTTGTPVDHRNRSYVESVAAQYFYEPKLKPENRSGRRITFTGSTHFASIKHALPQKLSTQNALTCDDAKVNGIGMNPGMLHC